MARLKGKKCPKCGRPMEMSEIQTMGNDQFTGYKEMGEGEISWLCQSCKHIEEYKEG